MFNFFENENASNFNLNSNSNSLSKFYKFLDKVQKIKKLKKNTKIFYYKKMYLLPYLATELEKIILGIDFLNMELVYFYCKDINKPSYKEEKCIFNKSIFELNKGDMFNMQEIRIYTKKVLFEQNYLCKNHNNMSNSSIIMTNFKNVMSFINNNIKRKMDKNIKCQILNGIIKFNLNRYRKF